MSEMVEKVRAIRYECPTCQGEMRVLDSRYRRNQVKRRRLCIVCGERLTTIEIPAAEYEVLQAPYFAEGQTARIIRAYLREIDDALPKIAERNQ
jgi:transcriptional regulator NrdR family protein